ncbi:hypothetical protein DL98DRAFT_566817 [Cadophora sp. DSE1049]|nr:hypothetical protein DL98DRAFT_566817 [Cadophora sp. DSE1049]
MMLDTVDDALQSLECTVKGKDIQSSPAPAFQCEATSLGVLLRGLQPQELWSRPSLSGIRMSIHDLLRILRYRIENPQVFRLLPNEHDWCFTRKHLWSAATSVLSRTPNSLCNLTKLPRTLPFWKSGVWTELWKLSRPTMTGDSKCPSPTRVGSTSLARV